MTKGELRLRITNRNRVEHTFVYTNPKGKQASLLVTEQARFYEVPDPDKNGASYEAEAEIDVNRIVRCVVPGHEKQAAPPSEQPKKKRKLPDHVAWGTAPYNFAPYAVDRVMGPVEDEPRKWQGRILCSIKALTPLLVSGGGKKEKDESTSCHFNTVNGKYVIPGSSLKGMLRSLMEILSCSGLRPLSDKKYFWRYVVGGAYRKKFSQALTGGFLIRRGADYYIRKATVEKVKTSGENTLETGKTIKEKRPNYYRFTPEQGAPEKIDREVFLQFERQMTEDQKRRWKNASEKLSGKGAPVFYIEEGGKITELGLCRYFRLAYKYSPRELAWPNGGSENVDDMAASIFGTVKPAAVRGRVAIEACEMAGTEAQEAARVVLGEPKPTCLPFYLVQDPEKIKVDKSKKNMLTDNYDFIMKSYNDRNARLRGRKLYWHHDVKLPNAETANKKTQSNLFPLQPGAEGRFVIHVDRLTDSELGCLFEAIELKPECRHKLGMGKSLGYGSVEIRIEKAEIADMGQKYASLAQRLELRAPELDGAARAKLREIFRARVLKFARENIDAQCRDFYELEQIGAMMLMLNWQDKPEAAMVCSMKLDCFKKKPLLPEPDEIKKIRSCCP